MIMKRTILILSTLSALIAQDIYGQLKPDTKIEKEKQKAPATPTLAFFTNPELMSTVRGRHGKHIAQVRQPVIEPLLQREIASNNTHESFYHAQKIQFLVFYDVLKTIYKTLSPGISLDHFTFLRFWHKSVPQKSAQDFIDAQEAGNRHKSWNDGQKDIAEKILSVNYSLFGNATGGSCTFDYFINNTNNVHYPLSELLEPIFAHYNIHPKHIQELEKVSQLFNQRTTGALCQIFIPKSLVDKCVYISSPGGTPYRSEIPGVAGFDKAKNRYTQISSLLHAYRSQPSLIKNSIEGLQARIVFIPEMLDPKSGVNIFTYNTIDPKVMQEYQSQRNAICKDIIAELTAQQNIKPITAQAPLRSKL